MAKKIEEAGQPGEPTPPVVPAPSITLSNKETAEQFNCTYNENCRVHVPGVWAGLISDVPPHVAEVLIQQGHRAFVKK